MKSVPPNVPDHLVPPGSVVQTINGPNNEWEDLPVVRTPNGYVVTRWELTPDERVRVAAGEDVYLTIVSVGTINPVDVSVGPADWSDSPVAEALEMEVMVHRYLYYVLGRPVISDADYDLLERRARTCLVETSPVHGVGSDLESSYHQGIKTLALERLRKNPRTT